MAAAPSGGRPAVSGAMRSSALDDIDVWRRCLLRHRARGGEATAAPIPRRRAAGCASPRPMRCPPSSEPPPLAFAPPRGLAPSPPGPARRWAPPRASGPSQELRGALRRVGGRLAQRARDARDRVLDELAPQRLRDVADLRVLALRRLLLGGLPLPRRQLVDAVPRRQPLRRALAAAAPPSPPPPAAPRPSGASDAPSSSVEFLQEPPPPLPHLVDLRVRRREPRRRVGDAEQAEHAREEDAVRELRAREAARAPTCPRAEDEREGDRRERPLRGR